MAVEDGIFRSPNNSNNLFFEDTGVFIWLRKLEDSFDITSKIAAATAIDFSNINSFPVMDSTKFNQLYNNAEIVVEEEDDQEIINQIIDLLYYAPSYKKEGSNFFLWGGAALVVGAILYNLKNKSK